MTGIPFLLALLLIAAANFPEFTGVLVLIVLAFLTAFATMFCSARLARSTSSTAISRLLTLVTLPASVVLSVVSFQLVDLNAEHLWSSWPMLALFVSAPWALGYLGGLLDRLLPSFDDDPNPLLLGD
jgi:hypothetical protein